MATERYELTTAWTQIKTGSLQVRWGAVEICDSESEPAEDAPAHFITKDAVISDDLTPWARASNYTSAIIVVT